MGSFAAELTKLARRPATWILVGVWLTVSTAFGYLFPYLSYRSGESAEGGPGQGATPEQILTDLLPGNLVANIVAGLPFFGGAIALILGALSTGSEYGWGTLKTVFTQGPRRLTVYAAKLGALVLVLLGVVLATLVVGAAVSWAIAYGESRPADWPGIVDILQGVGAGWLILSAWSVLGALFGLLFQSMALAVGLGLVWSLVLESLIRGMSQVLSVFDTLQRALPGVNAGSVAAAFGAQEQDEANGTPGVAAVVDGTQGALVLVVYLVAFAVIGGSILRRRDVT